VSISTLYSAVDAVLTHHALDTNAATLARRAAVQLPAKVQYAWPHPSGRFLYVSTSSGGPRVASSCNHVTSLAIGEDGALRLHGEPRPLPRRAVHVCVDPTGRFVMNAHNYQGGGATVHRIEADGTLGAEVPQREKLDAGIYPHQGMFFPSGRTVLLVDRGNQAQGDKPEDPGALRTYTFEEGVLRASQVVAPGGGYGFGPRHVAFHPSMRWMYVSDERTNRLYMFRFDQSDRLEAAPAFTLSTLAQPGTVRPRQLAGAIHVHPSGRFVYVANRADHTVEHASQPVFSGGENNIAVFAIDAQSGEPRLVQHADTAAFHVRTFACDPGGDVLVTASIKALARQQGDAVRVEPASLNVFRVDASGRLALATSVPVETPGSQLQYWMGIVGARRHDA
jgi:6-phosphogluconolactonase (cycloisomerase 2 family)